MSLQRLVRFAFFAALASGTWSRAVVLDDRRALVTSSVVLPKEQVVSFFRRQESTPATPIDTAPPSDPTSTPVETSPLPTSTPAPTPGETSPTAVEPARETRGCSPKTCGQACDPGEKTSTLAKRAVPRTTEPEACRWAGPENYANSGDFMASEGNLGRSAAPGTENSFIVPLPEDGRTSSKMVSFLDKPVTLAIPHLVGCTSIIVVSKKGTWANHIWELPTFRPDPNEDEETGEQRGWFMPGFVGEDRPTTETFPQAEQLAFFKSNAIDRLHSRYDPVTDAHESGLDPLREAGNLFDDESEFRVFMYAPFVTIFDENDPNYMKEKPEGLKPAWDRDGEPNPRGDEGTTAYNDQIKAEIRTIFGKQDLDIEVILYAPDVEDFEDAGFDSHRGRALVQYQPGDGNEDGSKAQWRIFFEAEVEAHDGAEWDPLGSQGDKPAQRCTPP
ncbi:hypothetical protein K458DRAFT_407615 [Lentithecium fluviatile CBS 122367]|uniref:Uncharacterized protein n=1 Tax=Lentithecium fluviatile CBS 122367 TaxID=1168545 RepID=A0A6G1IPL3_9PLEO|nr:hypothetical protein K458DRAFT_407615 [Lentithecium fluviatile CBS 122367]